MRSSACTSANFKGKHSDPAWFGRFATGFCFVSFQFNSATHVGNVTWFCHRRIPRAFFCSCLDLRVDFKTSGSNFIQSFRPSKFSVDAPGVGPYNSVRAFSSLLFIFLFFLGGGRVISFPILIIAFQPSKRHQSRVDLAGRPVFFDFVFCFL